MTGELEVIRKELEGYLEELEMEQKELDKIETVIQMNRQQETNIRNEIINISKKIRVVQDELECYLLE